MATDATYCIDVLRKSSDGILTFKSGAVDVFTTCWWDKKTVIDAGTYLGYATRMANKSDGSDGGKREAIWLGTRVPFNGGKGKADGFFIHKGLDASWSEGCIVLGSAYVYQIWSSINPKETPNIKVIIRDAMARPPMCQIKSWF